jgi:hypothetical protein
MIAEWLTVLEATALARGLRDSVWAYPLVNAGHVAGVALLVGAIVPLDLRLLRLWQSVPLVPLWQVLTRTAAAGLLLAIGFGFLLFMTQATEYVNSRLFISKMAVVGGATANALILRLAVSDEGLQTGSVNGKLPLGVRLSGGISLIGWLTALILGRLIGYF